MRGVDQPQGDAVREQADRDLRAAQEPLETGLRAGLPAMVRGLGRVIEADPGLDLLEQQEPLRLGSRRVREFPDGVGRTQRLVVLGQRDFQGIRKRSAFTGSDQIGRFPAENVGRKLGELPDRRSGVGFALQDDVLDAVEEAGMVGDDVLVRVRPGGGQRGRRDDQAHGLEVAEPFLVRDQFRVSGHDVTPSPARDRPGRSARCAGPSLRRSTGCGRARWPAPGR